MLNDSLSLFFEGIIKKNYRIGEFCANRLKNGTLKQIQNEKLKRLLPYLKNNSKFYKKQFEDNRIFLEDIKNVDDLTYLPFTTQDDLINSNENFLCTQNEKLKYKFISTGTSGKPKQIFFSRYDLENHINTMAIGLFSILRGNRTAQILFDPNKEGWNVAYLIRNALERMNYRAMITGNRLEPEKQIEIMRRNNVTVIFGTASYLNRITNEIKDDLTNVGIKKMILGAEPLQEDLREFLKKKWGCNVYDAYGMAELGFGFAIECKMHKGMHYNNSDFVVEIINPKTGKRVGKTESGELVFTTLSRREMPLLRYKSGDIGSLIEEECECGLKTERISNINSRIDDIITIGTGENFHPYPFNKILNKIDYLLDYNIVISKKGYKDLITINCTVRENNKSLMEKIEKHVLEGILSIDNIRYDTYTTKTIAMPIVTFSDKIINTANKARHFIDTRYNNKTTSK